MWFVQDHQDDFIHFLNELVEGADEMGFVLERGGNLDDACW